MDKESAAELYFDTLQQHGYSPRLEYDGAISFTHQGHRHFLTDDGGETHLVRIVVTSLEDCTEENYAAVTKAMAIVNGDCRLIKLFLREKLVIASVEHVFAHPEHALPVLHILLTNLDRGVRSFLTTLQTVDARIVRAERRDLPRERVMYCKKCGQQLPDDANFCLKCGTPQRAGMTPPGAVAAIVRVPFNNGRRECRVGNGRVMFVEVRTGEVLGQIALKDIAHTAPGQGWFGNDIHVYGHGGSDIAFGCSSEESRRIRDAISKALLQ